MARVFGPSNEPMTCLYCGTKLRRQIFKAHRYTQTISLCCQAPIVFATIPDPSTLANWRNSKACQTCGREITGHDDTEDRVVERPERQSRYAGRDDTFCTVDCGYRFGLLAARKGVRYRAIPKGV